MSVKGETPQTFTIEQRMGQRLVPAVSVAVAREGKFAWAATYGKGVTTDSLFQAASLSKAVAAAGLVRFAEEKGIDLDADVTPLITSFDLKTANPKGLPVTLRKLLSHTAGATVGGFPGYAAGVPIPSNVDVVLGRNGANTDAVRIAPDPERAFRYAGGGYQIAQVVAEDQSGQSFADLMAEQILKPLDMTSSTFVILDSMEEGLGTRIAPAHDGAGKPIAGGWHRYPEGAAAGLWTTPTDYLKFVLALIPETSGVSHLSAETIAAIRTAPSDGYGLGIGIRNAEGDLQLRHGGANRGYRCFFVAFANRGDAAVVMTNASGGSGLGTDILRSMAMAYGWPIEPVKEVEEVVLDASVLASFVGDYALRGATDIAFTVKVAGRRLTGEASDGVPFTLVHIGDNSFIDLDDAQMVSFVTQEDGTMVAKLGRTAFVRITPE